MIDWLNLGLPFQDEMPNALAPGGPTGGSTITGAPIALLSFTAPEELAKMMAKQGVRPTGLQTAQPAQPPMPTPEANLSAAPGMEGVNGQTAMAGTGPAGLAGVPGRNATAAALGAVKALTPPAAPFVPAPAVPRLDSPAAYKPDASQIMQLMSLMQNGGGPMPTLAQLMGGMR